MSNIQKWGSFDASLAKQEKQDLKNAGGGEFMKLEEGRTVVRVLPGPPGQPPFVKVSQHFIRPPGADRPAVFNCPRVMAKQKCPACVQADRLKRSGNTKDQEMARDYFPKMRVFYAVINRAEPGKGPQILGVGKTIHEPLMDLRVDPDVGVDFTNPAKGHDIIITRVGSTKHDTEYSVKLGKQCPLGNEDFELPDLARFGLVLSWDEIEGLFAGAGAAPPEAPPVAARKAKPVAVDAEVADDDDVPF